MRCFFRVRKLLFPSEKIISGHRLITGRTKSDSTTVSNEIKSNACFQNPSRPVSADRTDVELFAIFLYDKAGGQSGLSEKVSALRNTTVCAHVSSAEGRFARISQSSL